MTVYVDAVRVVGRTRRWPFTTASHLLADSTDELHAFAVRIGLRREWYQHRSHPHYDLTARMHTIALENGAKLVDRRELVAIMQRSRP